jgi:hypothetical protein
MKKIILIVFAAMCLMACKQEIATATFIRVEGQDLLSPDGEKFFIRGTNLGNWLNPEGYMFNFRKTNSPHFIDEMLCQLVGPDHTAAFWKTFKDNYITAEDIRFIRRSGANTIRVPFHYKLFTDEDYMGLTVAQDGFTRIDSLVEWCRAENLYIILDMHDAPGGQTGDNIDDSYGYPWLLVGETCRQQFCDIWQKIAAHYKNEPMILGYDLLNEPVAPYFENDLELLNGNLEAVYKQAVAAIRQVDTNHIILLGGAQWNSNFRPFADSTFDDNIMYTCHRYGGAPTADAIRSFIQFRDSVDLPMYMGEIGHNTNEWMNEFCKTMKENNIGWTFWPYKKMNGSCWAGIIPPENWELIVQFAEAPRTTYGEIREARPDQTVARQALTDFLEACRLENNRINTDYINALDL